MKIQDFLMKAVLGGWKPKDNMVVDEHNDNTFAQLVLDPLAWQAVGKVEGWPLGGDACISGDGCIEGQGSLHEGLCEWKNYQPEWQWYMHRMIDALAEGKTIEQFLETL